VILRTLQLPAVPANGSPAIPAWEAIERSQQEIAGAKECWLITQPSHAALAAEIAVKLKPATFGTMDETTVRAIALHDSGWSASDANAIQLSRSMSGKNNVQLLPFTAVHPTVAVNACAASIDIAEKASALGGFLVSEHFRNIFLIPGNNAKAPELMNKFVAKEEQREKRLRAKIKMPDQELQRLVEGLRFCDLLSLYLCSGATQSIEFPQKISGKNIFLKRSGDDECSVTPFPFDSDEIFGISAIRHPKQKDQSGARFFLKVTA
jgi:hypothetical protein